MHGFLFIKQKTKIMKGKDMKNLSGFRNLIIGISANVAIM